MRYTQPVIKNEYIPITNGKHAKLRNTLGNQSSFRGNQQNCLSTTNLMRSENDMQNRHDLAYIDLHQERLINNPIAVKN